MGEGKGRGGKGKVYVRRKVLASSQAVSMALRFWTRRAKRTVVTMQFLRRGVSCARLKDLGEWWRTRYHS